MEVHYMSKSTDWATPLHVFNPLHEEFNFTLDPCATKESAKCDKFYTKEEDGLSKSWDNERVFMNPPYGREIKHWVKKAYEAKALVVGLLPARTDTRWFHEHIYNIAEIRFIKGRINFINGLKPQPAPFPSMIVIFN